MESRVQLASQIRAKIAEKHLTKDVSWVQKGEAYTCEVVAEEEVRNSEGEITQHEKKERLSLRDNDDKNRYDNLRNAIKKEGAKAITEKAAYTWFNRIVAIRYMELNEMLPQGKHNEWLGIRVLSDSNNQPDPEILRTSNLRRSDLDLPLDVDATVAMNRDDEKFREVLFAVTKKLGTVMPDVFNGETASINFLLPDNLLGAGGFVNEILKLPVECFDRVEVIGWLYQYYNQAEKDIAMKKKSAVQKDEIPYVTQIFTPDWIVKYMVENSLGRYWLEHGGDPSLADNWKYLIKNGASSAVPTGKMTNIEEVTFIDPCAGSGHILVYAFEVFYQIYRSLGYTPEQIPEKILTHNLYGLDIDDRAKQLSILSAMLVAREHDKEFWNKHARLNITSVAESNGLYDLPGLLTGAESDMAEYLLDTFRDAKEYGSILRVKADDYSKLQSYVDNLSPLEKQLYSHKVKQLIHQANILSKKYTIAVTNPPYMNKYDAKLKAYINANYPESKSDMYSVFMEVLSDHISDDGRMAMVTPDSWMFLTGQAKLRERLESESHISSMIHLGNGAFPDVVVSTTTFVIKKGDTGSTGDYVRVVTGNEKIKHTSALAAITDETHELRFRSSNADFEVFPGKIIAYWASDATKRAFVKGVSVISISDPAQGLSTADNDRFLRLWHEVSCNNFNTTATSSSSADISGKKWFPHNKGGGFRKWYGNNDYVINWLHNGREIKEFKGAAVRNPKYFFKPSITWSIISSGQIAFRYKPEGHIFNMAGASIYGDDELLKYLQATLNSAPTRVISGMISPTLNNNIGEVSLYPIIQSTQYRDEVIRLVEANRTLSKADWDSFETSWDFERHPLLPTAGETSLVDTYGAWEREASDRWCQLKANEERLNEIFIEVYGMQDELTPEVEDKYVSVRKADLAREARSLLSYFVGVIFGRYSLDKPGINYAGGEWNASSQGSLVDTDNIVPIMDGEYYTDDIVKKLRDFLVTVYGESTLHANMDWLADALGRKSHEHAEDTLRRYFTDDFFADHFKVYGKRPIYWQLSSGKANGFKALFYLHRYQPNLIATVRTQYLLNTQNIYTKRLAELEAKSALNNDELKLKNDLIAKLAEIKNYDALIAVVASKSVQLDLDDGVKINYPKLSQAAVDTKPDSEILEMKGVKL